MNITEGITCKKCRKNEAELERLGIAMNIPLVTCNNCILKERGETPKSTKKVRPAGPSERQKKSEEFVLDLVEKYDVVLGEIRQGNDPRESGMDLKEMAEEFLVLIQRADRIYEL